MDSLNTILNSGTYGENVSRHNDNNSKIKQAITTLENVAIANKGYFDTLASLQAAFPSPKAGNIAYVANVASSTGYYIYNVVSGVWTATTTEAPAVGVEISNYAQHGYSSSPKTLKQVDDEVIQLAGDIAPPLISSDLRWAGIVDAFWGTAATKDLIFIPVQLYKSTGLIIIKSGASNYTITDSGEKKGRRLLKLSSPTNHIFIVVNWDLVKGDVYDLNNTSSFACSSPVLSPYSSIFKMWINAEFATKDNVVLNDDGIPQSYNCLWSDGTSGEATFSNYDLDVLEYKDCSVTYKSFTIQYGTIVFDENGYIKSQGITSILQ